MAVRVIGVNLFAFQYFHWKDKEKVLNERPWCFDPKPPNEVPFTHSPFWVWIHNLPFNCRTDDDVKAIILNMRRVLESELEDHGLEKYKRVKLLLDVNILLRRFQCIKNKEGKIIIIDHKYEPLFDLQLIDFRRSREILHKLYGVWAMLFHRKEFQNVT